MITVTIMPAMPLGEIIPQALILTFMTIAGATVASATAHLGCTTPMDGAVMASDGAVAITIRGDIVTALGDGAVVIMAMVDTPDFMADTVMAVGILTMVTTIRIMVATTDREDMHTILHAGGIIATPILQTEIVQDTLQITEQHHDIIREVLGPVPTEARPREALAVPEAVRPQREDPLV